MIGYLVIYEISYVVVELGYNVYIVYNIFGKVCWIWNCFLFYVICLMVRLYRIDENIFVCKNFYNVLWIVIVRVFYFDDKIVV